MQTTTDKKHHRHSFAVQHCPTHQFSCHYYQSLLLIFVIYTVSQKRPTFTTCYNFDVHSLIATVFGTNVAEKAGNQSVLYFPTSLNQCFCTTWGNRNPGNCICSLKWCMLFHQKNTKHSL